MYSKPKARAVIVALIAFVLSLVASWTGLLDQAENLSLDWRIKQVRGQCFLPSSIVLVLIDETSLEAMNYIAGRWPWDRRIHADVIDFLGLAGAKAVVFDVLFTERQTGETSLANQDSDLLLAEATSQTRVIHAAQLAGVTGGDSNRSKELPRDFKDRFTVSADLDGLELVPHFQFYLPLKQVRQASSGIGVVTVYPDPDGVIRRMPVVFALKDQVLPGLALAAILDDVSKATLKRSGSMLLIDSVSGKYRIPTDRKGMLWINPYGRYQAYSYSGLYMSVRQVFQGRLGNLAIDPSVFKDKIVFIGASAAGVEDLKSTSLGPRTPGVLLHASVLANILENDFLRPLPKVLDLGVMIILAVVPAFCVVYCNRLWVQLMGPFSFAAAMGAAGVVLAGCGWIVAMAGPGLAFFLAWGGGFAGERLMERMEKGRIRNILGQYVSPAVLDTVIACHREDYLGAEVGTEQKLTILFSDLRGFTSISESMPVDKVVDMLNRYLSLMTDKIFEHHGTLDKFIGDAVVAFWGAPLPDREHELNAVSCAIAMQKALENFNRYQRKPAEPLLRMGVGVNTDRVILGNIGSTKKLDYTIIGDGVNLASRLEGLTKRYGVPILISHGTYRRVRSRILCRPIDVVKVRGRKGKTRIYQPMGMLDRTDRSQVLLAAMSRQALEAFLEGHYVQACKAYEKILEFAPGDKVAEIFARRCRSLRTEPGGQPGKCHYLGRGIREVENG